MSNLFADFRIHYIDTISISKVALVTVGEHGKITSVVTHLGRVTPTNFHGQERLVCFLACDIENPEGCSIVVVHLDHPATTLRVDIPYMANLSVSLCNSLPLSETHQAINTKGALVRYLLALSRLARSLRQG